MSQFSVWARFFKNSYKYCTWWNVLRVLPWGLESLDLLLCIPTWAYVSYTRDWYAMQNMFAMLVTCRILLPVLPPRIIEIEQRALTYLVSRYQVGHMKFTSVIPTNVWTFYGSNETSFKRHKKISSLEHTHELHAQRRETALSFCTASVAILFWHLRSLTSAEHHSEVSIRKTEFWRA